MKNSLWKRVIVTVAFLIAGAGAVAGAAWFLTGGVSWKEEALLHDGSKIIVQRTQYYGGRREIGQDAPLREETVSFTLPGSGERITWKNEYGEEIGRANFRTLALHILDQVPYIVAVPNLCLSYNKWGRPNPPYVVFKYGSGAWKQIPLQDLPTEFDQFNLLISAKSNKKIIASQSFLEADLINKLNDELNKKIYKKILREPFRVDASTGPMMGCDVLIYDGKGTWKGLNYYVMRKSKEACVGYCEERKISGAYCPCDELFSGEK